MRWISFWHVLSAETSAIARVVCAWNCAKKFVSLTILTSIINEFMIKNETRISEEAKKHYSKYLLRRLLPFVKQIDVEQSLEKEMEAQIRGLPLSDVKVQQADCCDDERLNCNNCGTSIADYHRSCTKCPYDLCISCCRDLRAGSLHAGHMGSMNQYKNPGVGYLHGETCKPRNNRTVGTSTATKDGGPRKAKLPEWRPNKDGSISCPPESLGGCGGKGILRLNQVFQDGWLSDVILKAEDLCQLYNLDGMPEDPTHGCSCYNLAVDETATKTIRKAASRDRSDDNYLYSPSSGDIQAGDRKHFQAHWSKGEPVIVTGVLDSTYGLSWEPMVMSRAMHDKSHTRVTVLNCLNWCKEEYSLSSFFKGYTEGKLDLSGWPQMLKLNDWPPSGSFEDHLPRHNVEFLSALPFKEYTHPQSGYLNLAIKLPECHLKPDTGPKLYAAYGFSQQLGRGDSVSKLSYHDSDAVYVLTHVKEMTFTPSELAKMEQLKEKHRVQDEREIYVEGEMGNGPEPQREGNDTEELQNPESGALWDIYRREDAFKLKEYLRKHFREFRHTYCLPLKQVVDPIYDGAFYLNAEHQRRLKEEYGIEPWSVVQNLGDAIFIPAGCPFQVRNFKSCIQVSTGFVSPESIHECLRFTEEIRALPLKRVAKEDKLGVKKLIIYAIRQVLNDLEEITKSETMTDCLDIHSDSLVESGYVEKKNCENLEESAGQDEEITNLDFEAHGPNPLVGRTGRTRKSAKKQSENIGHTHSEDLEKMRKEIAAEMDDKMNKKLRKILGRLAEMNPTLNVNVEELCGETDGSDDEDDGEENDKDDDAEGDGNGSANDEDDEVGSDDGDD
ncbi:lysine-specific demethylase JMJ26-like [Daucus carota subsp. sativus]|uniref:lysine-specific demethylase JMJ26-like n=1 Tax=Daucus carota subsp. sativus TaxID=79200 RepID=UPI003082FF1C